MHNTSKTWKKLIKDKKFNKLFSYKQPLSNINIKLTDLNLSTDPEIF